MPEVTYVEFLNVQWSSGWWLSSEQGVHNNLPNYRCLSLWCLKHLHYFDWSIEVELRTSTLHIVKYTLAGFTCLLSWQYRTNCAKLVCIHCPDLAQVCSAWRHLWMSHKMLCRRPQNNRIWNIFRLSLPSCTKNKEVCYYYYYYILFILINPYKAEPVGLRSCHIKWICSISTNVLL
jgi:hypothetical protein